MLAAQELDVSYNNLTGDIVDLLHLTFGKRLVLSGNQFYGTLPPMSSYIPGYVRPITASLHALEEPGSVL